MINDANYTVSPVIAGRQVVCPFYRKWRNMHTRAYHQPYAELYPTYEDVTVCQEWHIFSNFKAWMEQQDWEGKQLDKDILVPGSKVYSPDTCCFISQRVNKFCNDNARFSGDWPIGVDFHKSSGAFRAQVRWNGKKQHLGNFISPNHAHLAWARRKLLLTHELCEEEALDSRVATALVAKYTSILQEAEDKVKED